jgi:hypothetical protein
MINVNYDARIIQEFADRLYKRANSIITMYTLVGLFLGSAPAFFLMTESGTETTTTVIATGIVALFAGLIGFSIGRERVFRMKLQAQTALCQLKIEENTSGRNLEKLSAI